MTTPDPRPPDPTQEPSYEAYLRWLDDGGTRFDAYAALTRAQRRAWHHMQDTGERR